MDYNNLENARKHIEEVLHGRYQHNTKDEVSDTLSSASVERTLQKGYYGRFLIELIQNARDAWLSLTDNHKPGKIRIRLSKDKALLVCNSGVPFTSQILLFSLGKFGQSTKDYGESIGHKGIGFKAVLEISLCPEIYSREDSKGPFDIAIRFDPQKALEKIKSSSPDWEKHVSSLPGKAMDKDLTDLVPVLQFPIWSEKIPNDVKSCADKDIKFNTVIRVPFNNRDENRLNLNEKQWVSRVRNSMNEINDEMVLLLGVFENVLLEDEIEGKEVSIERHVLSTRDLKGNIKVSKVQIERNGSLSSTWLLYESRISGFQGLEGDLSAGVRLIREHDNTFKPIPAAEVSRKKYRAAPYYLFFPTEISSHLPFLLNAYFEVDAGRQRFAKDAIKKNKKLLKGLETLVVAAVNDLVARAKSNELNLEDFPALFFDTGEIEDELACNFRDSLLHRLDKVRWVQIDSSTGEKNIMFKSPLSLLAGNSKNLTGNLRDTFSRKYISKRLKRFYPHPNLSEEGYDFLFGRINEAGEQPNTDPLDFKILHDLLTPGEFDPYGPDRKKEEGFVGLVTLFEKLRAGHEEKTESLFKNLRGNDQARYIPVIAEAAGKRRLISPPTLDEEITGSQRVVRDRIFARVRDDDSSTDELVPPGCLKIQFLPDGVIKPEQIALLSKHTGISEYTTDAIIERLSSPNIERDHRQLLQFFWRLLLREQKSRFGIRSTAQSLSSFQPGKWFWCFPGRTKSPDETEVQQQYRALSNLEVPTRSGIWRQACEVAFGEDWAKFLDKIKKDAQDKDSSDVISKRIEAYKDMEKIAPGKDYLIASPRKFMKMLTLKAKDLNWLQDKEAPSLFSKKEDQPISITDNLYVELLHLFFLSLGVWEIPPINAVENLRDKKKELRDPWKDKPQRKKHIEHIKKEDGFKFNASYEHKNWQIAKDFELAWPFDKNQNAYFYALSRGISFYSNYKNMLLYCPQCPGSRHRSRKYNDNQDNAPSRLSWQLQEEAWVPAAFYNNAEKFYKPCDTWWLASPPTEQYIDKSPFRHLPIAFNIKREMAEFAKVNILEEAEPDRIYKTLRDMRKQFEQGKLPEDPNENHGARHTFIGIHRILWERLTKVLKDDESLASNIAEIGLLAEIGSKLCYVKPKEARHDNGKFAYYKQHFIGQVPFVTLNREQDTIAKRLGVAPFNVKLSLNLANKKQDVTEQFLKEVLSYLPEIISLMVFYRIGGMPMELGGETFQNRVERLKNLKIIKSEEVIVKAGVDGSRITKTIGDGMPNNIYLHEPLSAKPILYHNIQGINWADELKRYFAPHLATILENPAYTDTFALLLNMQTETERGNFLIEKGISGLDLEQINEALDVSDAAKLAIERNWWEAIFELIGEEISLPNDETEFYSSLYNALSSSRLKDSLAEKLKEQGGGHSVRRDTSPTGSLFLLENAGFNLFKLHKLLKEKGDQGLKIRVAEEMLNDWKRRYAHYTAWVLYCNGLNETQAKEKADNWRAPGELDYCININLEQVIKPVVSDLRAVGLDIKADDLTGEEVIDKLAALAHEENADALKIKHVTLYDEEERQKLELEIAIDCRRHLKPVLVAMRTNPADQPFQIRQESDFVSEKLDSCRDMNDIKNILPNLLKGKEKLLKEFLAILSGQGSLRYLDKEALETVAKKFIKDKGHLSRVHDILKQDVMKEVDNIRKSMEIIKSSGLSLKPYQGSTKGPDIDFTSDEPSKPFVKKTVRKTKVKKPHNLTEKIGLEAENKVLAAVISKLLSYPESDLVRIIKKLKTLLSESYDGEVVKSLMEHADNAIKCLDDEDRLILHLANFLHLSKITDDFGCDILGFMELYNNEEAKPVFLEVKGDLDQTFQVSKHEWEQAKVLGPNYAFLVVIRAGNRSNIKFRFELLPDPARLLDEEKLSINPDGWVVAYRNL